MDTSPRKASHGRFRYRRLGVYDLTYEDLAPLTSRIYSLSDGFRAFRDEIPHGRRQVADAIKLAPAEFVVYTITTIWQGIYQAINLYWLSVLFDKLGEGLTDGAILPDVYRPLAFSWIFCAMVNVAAERACARSFETLTQRFRAYFIPQLIRASMKVDLLSSQDLYSIFPVMGRLESEFPGGYFLSQLSQYVKCTLALVSQMLVLLYAIHHKSSPEREVLLCICVVRGLLRWLAPSNDIGCSAYIYWPNNCHFQRMKALFGLAFSTQYRADLIVDGIASSIETEYKKSAERLGDVEVLDPQTPWRILRQWYWSFLTEVTSDLSMAVYVLVLAANLSPSSIASMVLLQQATRSISLSIGQCGEDMPSLLSACVQGKRLYNAIDHQSTMPQGTEPFPRPADNSSDAGMKISFRHVSLRYPGSDCYALFDVSFEILPGELVLVVGVNGSGKSSMLKLLARLFDPTVGEILVDDLPLIRYDTEQLRAAMAFQSQSPVIYPVTVKENIAFGLPLTFNIEEEHVEEAARMGNCSEWISRLNDGYDTQLQPSFDITNQWIDGTYGCPSDALKEELARHKGHVVSISGGEKQRLAAARAFMRINNRATRLVVVDEATSALDPVAEHGILTELLNLRAGKTIVIVAHRFHHLAQEADRILCMKDGCVVENGTHAELVRAKGDYAALYHAQVQWTA